KIFNIRNKGKQDEATNQLFDLVETGRLPISLNNVEFVDIDEGMNMKEIINEKSMKAGLTMLGFRSEQVKHEGIKLFEGFNNLGDILFVNAYKKKEIE
ncbi:MAG: amino acid permease, partial [Bacteroidota bacterium]